MNQKIVTTARLLMLSIAFAALGAIITYFNAEQESRSTELVISRYKSMLSSNELLSLLKDMETGQRGYVISADSDFLTPYTNARALLHGKLDTLRLNSKTGDSLTSLLCSRIDMLIKRRSAEIEHVLYLAASGGEEAAELRISSKVGKNYMDSVRLLMAALDVREEELLSRDRKELSRRSDFENSFRFFAFTLIGATCLVAIYSLKRKNKTIDELIHSLTEAKETLEVKVAARTAELVKANEAKNHFLAIATHDLKAPIAQVQGLIPIIISESNELTNSAAEAFNYMDTACKKMQSLIGDLLDVNRIESGEMKVNITMAPIANVLNAIESAYRHEAARKKIDLVVEPCEGIVQTDTVLLGRVLDNLVSNAVKFSFPNSEVRVSAQVHDSTVVFKVRDYGAGIAPAELPGLFKKFSRASNKPTGGESSTGLGLSIAKELVELLNGTIEVWTALGQGVEFTVALPQVHQMILSQPGPVLFAEE